MCGCTYYFDFKEQRANKGEERGAAAENSETDVTL
jgi:hypothetical protein